jgi:hypothetical protein
MLFPRPEHAHSTSIKTRWQPLSSTTGHQELRLLAEFTFSGRSSRPWPIQRVVLVFQASFLVAVTFVAERTREDAEYSGV